MMNLIRPLHLGLIVTSLLAQGADWPQYRGVNGDGKSSEKILSTWPANGLRTVWKIPTTGGFSVFAVSKGLACTTMVREIDGAKREVCVGLNAADGKEIWATPLGVAKYDGGGDDGAADNKGGDGPRSTPSIDGDQVYVLDPRMVLYSLDIKTGKVLWSKDLVADQGAKLIQWQNAASPVIDGESIYVCTGAEGGSLASFSKKDGSPIWKIESDKMTHATPVVATILGVRQVVFYTQKGLAGVECASGKLLWRYPFDYAVSSAASPIVAGDIVYCSAGYNTGAGAARISKEGDAFSAKELWRIKGNKIANHWSTPVLKDGYLYGMFSFKEHGKGNLKCYELATGKEVWAQPGFGPGGVILAGDLLISLSDKGELVLVEPKTEAYKELGRFQAIKGKCWNHPTLSGGRIFARGTQEGACFDASPQSAQ
jgi:outer membrane protein assembly factor BamB